MGIYQLSVRCALFTDINSLDYYIEPFMLGDIIDKWVYDTNKQKCTKYLKESRWLDSDSTCMYLYTIKLN